MKGKKLSSQSVYDLSIGGIPTGFGGMIFETEEESKIRRVFNTKDKDWVVDTAYTPDTGYWETGIESKFYNGGFWVIVDEYEDKKRAGIAHKKWVKFIKTKPKKLTDIHQNKVFERENDQ